MGLGTIPVVIAPAAIAGMIAGCSAESQERFVRLSCGTMVLIALFAGIVAHIS